MMSGSGQETIPDVREWSRVFPDVWKWTGGPPKCPGVVGRSTRVSGSGREALTGVLEALPDVRE